MLRLKPHSLVLISGKVPSFFPTPYPPHPTLCPTFTSACHPVRIVSICGYAKQVQTTASVKQLDAAIAHLQQLQVFANTIIARFSKESRWKYPKVQIYLQMLDYLRLLTLEYLQIQQTIQPISA